MPPTFAAKATPSNRGTRIFLSSAPSRTATTKGSIINVVAVLDIHILNPADAIINPKINDFPPPPKSETIFRASLRWAPDFSIALDNKNPPNNNKTSLCPYACATCFESSTPRSGSMDIGTNDATGIGTASNTHQIAVQIVIHSVIPATMSSPWPMAISPTSRLSTGPIILARLLMFFSFFDII